MQNFLTVFALSFSMFLSAQRISWSKENPLRESDFQSPVRTTTSDSAVAISSVGITYHIAAGLPGQRKVTFQAFFDPKQSWRDAKNWTPRVLNHEQRHFDIAQIFARRMQRQFASRQVTDAELATWVRRVYQEQFREFLEFQKLYDMAAGFGSQTEQARYDRIIDRLLSEF